MEWRPVIGFEGLYEVSDTGEIASLKYGKRRILRKKTNDQGYHTVSTYKDGKQYCLRVNRCVASSFIANPKNKPFVNHINKIRNDNRVENLEWVTHRENMVHAFNTSGDRRKFTIDDINKMYQIIKNKGTLRDVCVAFDFKNKTAIHNLLTYFHPEY
jgi:hypothetical protein